MPTSAKEVATVGKDKNDEFAMMVAHDAAGYMMPPFVNTKAPAPNVCKFLIPPGGSPDDIKEYSETSLYRSPNTQQKSTGIA